VAADANFVTAVPWAHNGPVPAHASARTAVKTGGAGRSRTLLGRIGRISVDLESKRRPSSSLLLRRVRVAPAWRRVHRQLRLRAQHLRRVPARRRVPACELSAGEAALAARMRRRTSVGAVLRFAARLIRALLPAPELLMHALRRAHAARDWEAPRRSGAAAGAPAVRYDDNSCSLRVPSQPGCRHAYPCTHAPPLARQAVS
jgi:hypothetical protein